MAHEVPEGLRVADALAGQRLGAAPRVERVRGRELAGLLEPGFIASRSARSVRYAGSMTGLAAGSPEVMRSVPRLAGRTSPTAIVHDPSATLYVGRWNGTWMNMKCRSGTSASGRLRGEHRRLGEVVLRRRNRLGGLPEHAHEQVVVQVAPDPGEVDADVDAGPRELFGWADPRPHQHDGRVDGTGDDDDLGGQQLLDPALALVRDAGAAIAGEDQLVGMGAGHDSSVPARRAAGCRYATAALWRLPSLISRSW